MSARTHVRMYVCVYVRMYYVRTYVYACMLLSHVLYALCTRSRGLVQNMISPLLLLADLKKRQQKRLKKKQEERKKEKDSERTFVQKGTPL